MPSNTDMVLWALTMLAELFAAYIFIVWGVAREFRCFASYLVFCFAASVTKFVVLQQYGLMSREYFECYWIASALGTGILYASVAELALRTARGGRLVSHVVGICVAGLFAIVLLSIPEMPLRIIFAVSEKLFWLSGAVIVGLCIWSFWQKDYEFRKRVVAFQLAKVMGVYFFLCALSYALFYLTNSDENIWGGLASAWLPIGVSLVTIAAPQAQS